MTFSEFKKKVLGKNTRNKLGLSVNIRNPYEERDEFENCQPGLEIRVNCISF